MATIGLTIENESVEAGKVLRAVQQTLKLLRVTETELTGKPAKTRWTVDILTISNRVVVKLSAMDSESPGVERIAFESARAAMAVMKTGEAKVMAV